VIAAVVLAAGEASRMGRSKLDLRAGGRSILARLVGMLLEAGASHVVVVTGGHRAAVEAALKGLPVEFVHNPAFREAGMLGSLQAGLRALRGGAAEAALIAPGDYPSVRAETVRALIAAWAEAPESIVVPSYSMRRGHPILVPAADWPAILALRPGETLRDHLRREAARVRHVVVDDPGVRFDVDTPEDYRRLIEGDEAQPWVPPRGDGPSRGC